MRPPFTTEQFLEVFRRYNEGVWPAQIVLTAVALIAMAAAYRAALKGKWNWARTALMITALLWLWTAIEYHLRYFADLTPAANVFGSFFIAQAVLLALSAWQPEPMFAPVLRPGVAVATVLMLYTFVAYPAINYFSGHHYPAVPTFGAPCPLTIFTFALFCLIPSMIARATMVIPLLWAAIGTSAALSLGIPADFGLLVSAAAMLWVTHYAYHRMQRSVRTTSAFPRPRSAAPRP